LIFIPLAPVKQWQWGILNGINKNKEPRRKQRGIGCSFLCARDAALAHPDNTGTPVVAGPPKTLHAASGEEFTLRD
jgi:hypothetical protein